MGTNGRIVKRCHLRIFSVLFMKYLMDIEKKQRRKHRVKDLVQKFAQSNNKQTEWCIPEEGGGYSWEFLVGVCRPFLQILTLFQTKTCHFPHPFPDLASKIHTRFQTWRWSQNVTLHVYIKRKLCHHC